MLAIFISLLALLAPTTTPTTPTATPATAPATQPDSDWKAAVLDRAGNDVWPTVTKLSFTFNVDRGGQVMSRSHVWDLTTGENTVVTPEGETIVNVWAFDPETATDAETAAYRAWTNDSYWLLMPLKLDDPGVNFGPVAMTRDLPPSRANVTMSFDDGTGLTPGDQYDLAIDLRENVVDGWTFRPNPNVSVSWAWEDYRDFNGLYLSTNRPPQSDGAPRIYFTDIEVERE
jgi:hypothetical protein